MWLILSPAEFARFWHLPDQLIACAVCKITCVRVCGWDSDLLMLLTIPSDTTRGSKFISLSWLCLCCLTYFKVVAYWFCSYYWTCNFPILGNCVCEGVEVLCSTISCMFFSRNMYRNFALSVFYFTMLLFLVLQEGAGVFLSISHHLCGLACSLFPCSNFPNHPEHPHERLSQLPLPLSAVVMSCQVLVAVCCLLKPVHDPVNAAEYCRSASPPAANLDCVPLLPVLSNFRNIFFFIFCCSHVYKESLFSMLLEGERFWSYMLLVSLAIDCLCLSVILRVLRCCFLLHFLSLISTLPYFSSLLSTTNSWFVFSPPPSRKYISV